VKERTIHKEVFYPHAPERVWVALTDPRALAEWLMPNDFRPEVGVRFRYHVDPMPGFSGISECEVLEVDPPRRLVYTWTVVPARPTEAPPPAMKLEWTLTPRDGGTALVLHQTGVEALNWWWRLSMSHGWTRMLRTLLPQVLPNVGASGEFTPGAIRKRDYGTRTVPEGYAR
jgi:uncharacterized protein YndB with AHSA1/START domain